VSAIAAPLAYIFAFESSAPEMDIAILSTPPSVDTQPSIVPASPRALPSMSERQDVLVRTQMRDDREVHVPPFPMTRRSEGEPNESGLTQPAPGDLESRTSESRMPEEGGAMPGVGPDDSDAPRLHEDQESSPPTMNLATESTTT